MQKPRFQPPELPIPDSRLCGPVKTLLQHQATDQSRGDDAVRLGSWQLAVGSVATGTLVEEIQQE